MFEVLTIMDSQVKLDISLIQGDTREIVLEFSDDAGNAYSLVGYDVKMCARVDHFRHSAIVLEKSIGKGLSIQGNALILNFGEDLNNVRLQTAYYDINFSKNRKSRRLVSGKIFIKSSITV